jgi:hypothetical protein
MHIQKPLDRTLARVWTFLRRLQSSCRELLSEFLSLISCIFIGWLCLGVLEICVIERSSDSLRCYQFWISGRYLPGPSRWLITAHLLPSSSCNWYKTFYYSKFQLSLHSEGSRWLLYLSWGTLTFIDIVFRFFQQSRILIPVVELCGSTCWSSGFHTAASRPYLSSQSRAGAQMFYYRTWYCISPIHRQ